MILERCGGGGVPRNELLGLFLFAGSWSGPSPTPQTEVAQVALTCSLSAPVPTPSALHVSSLSIGELRVRWALRPLRRATAGPDPQSPNGQELGGGGV